jgi:DNA-binding HxlR family transcriptional regulator
MQTTDTGLDVDLEAVRRRSERKREELSCGELQARQETVTEMLGLLGKAHTLAILGQFAFERGPHRFNELESALEISPNTLSNRLSELVEAGLLTRHSYDEIPPRVEYESTEKADYLAPVFGHLFAWAGEYDLEPSGE